MISKVQHLKVQRVARNVGCAPARVYRRNFIALLGDSQFSPPTKKDRLHKHRRSVGNPETKRDADASGRGETEAHGDRPHRSGRKDRRGQTADRGTHPTLDRRREKTQKKTGAQKPAKTIRQSAAKPVTSVHASRGAAARKRRVSMILAMGLPIVFCSVGLMFYISS